MQNTYSNKPGSKCVTNSPLLRCRCGDAVLCMLQGSDQADALSWQELKLAAEAGFEELLRHQEAAAAAGTASLRCPGMSRAKGGGAVPAAAVAVAAVVGPGETWQPVAVGMMLLRCACRQCFGRWTAVELCNCTVRAGR